MSIIDPNTPELLNHADTRYTLAIEAAKRARQIVAGAAPLIENGTEMKPLKTAVEEISRGLIGYDRPVVEEQAEE